MMPKERKRKKQANRTKRIEQLGQQRREKEGGTTNIDRGKKKGFKVSSSVNIKHANLADKVERERLEIKRPLLTKKEFSPLSLSPSLCLPLNA